MSQNNLLIMKKTITYSLWLFNLLLLPSFFMAQTTVSGIVTDASNGEPLIGVNVLIQGTSSGTVTDFDGAYSLTTDQSNPVLAFSYTGYEDQEIAITSTGNVTQNVAMGESSIQLKDVVVTANRVEENLQKIPVAATVMTGIDLQNRSAQTSLEGLTSTPGLIYDAPLPSAVTLSIRGIATNQENVGVEQGVGMYINDVYQSRPFGFNATLMDVERIEVLRGPQGTLFGKNTVGGVVHLITENPKMSNSGAIEVSAGNLKYFQLRGKANVMLVPDKLAFRLSGALSRREAGFVDHAVSENKMNFLGLKGSLLFRASEKVSAILDVNWSKDKSGETTYIYRGFPDFPGERPEDRVNNANTPFDWSRDQLSGSLRIKADLGGNNELNLISSLGGSEDFAYQESDWSAADYVDFSRLQDFSTFTQEIRINSDRDRKFAYVAGIFYANEKITGQDAGYFKEPLIPDVIAPLFGLPDGFTVPGYAEHSTTDAQTKSNSFSLFGSGTYKLSDKLKLTAGLRFIREDKDLTFNQLHTPHQGGVDAFGFPLVTAFFPDFQTEVGQDDSALSGNVNLEYAVTDNVLTYASFARGYKGSGFNFTENALPSNEGLVFAPEKVNNYEIGFKSKFNNRVRLNMAGYIMKYFDKQEIVVESTSTRIANAPESSGWGIEAELSAILAKGFQVDLSGAILDFEYDDFPFSEDPQTSGLPANLEGNRLSKVPENTWTISPQYSTTLGNGTKLLARVDINHTGQSFNDILNTEFIQRDAVTLMNARLSLDFNNGKYGIGLWGKNLTDEVYLAHGLDLIFGANANLNLRRSFGVDLRVAFY